MTTLYYLSLSVLKSGNNRGDHVKVIISELNWPEGIDILQEHAEVVYDQKLWEVRERLLEEVQSADILIVRNQTKVDKKLLSVARKLRVIGRLGVGIDNIDLEECKERNISVIYAKNANAISVAEYVISSILISNRNLLEATTDVKTGGWNRRRFTGMEVYGKTLGLIGLGEIGIRIATRAKALGINVIGSDPFLGPYDFAYAEVGVEAVSLEALLSRSDFISLHVPLTPKTRYLISEEELGRVKKDVTIINTSRGGIIQEEVLYTFLKDHPNAHAVLDVLEQEPPQSAHRLFQLDNVILTPHIAGLTEQSQQKTSVMIAQEVLNEIKHNTSTCKVK